MTAQEFSTDLPPWQKQAYQYWIEGNYNKAATLYEQAIEAEPQIKFNYWHLGLMLLLQGQEAEAQTTWLLAMAEGEAEQIEQWTAELIQVLKTEAERLEQLTEYSVAWAIREHLREICPTDVENLLYLVQLNIELKQLTDEELTSLGIIELLKSEQNLGVAPEGLLQVLRKVVSYAAWYPSAVEFATACLPHFARLPDVPELLLQLAGCYEAVGDISTAIESAKRCYSLSETLAEKIYSIYYLLRSLTRTPACWSEAFSWLQQQESLLLSLFAENPPTLDRFSTSRLLISSFFFPYFRDEPKSNRLIWNQIGQLSAAIIQAEAKEQAERYRQRRLQKSARCEPTKRLKIGYLSHCLRRHSVGWLARWLLQYHDRDRFEINAYLVNYEPPDDFLQEWYVSQVSQAHKLGIDGWKIAEQIYQDEIDILVELDSITIGAVGEVIALKPAPVQVTWLGWDASGIPGIDYFIADPYVLPESAQDYYTEKIWRLPQTYIAVDGFEVDVPSLRRNQLDIPSDAVVYLSAQRSLKQDPNTLRLQMRILKEVPNSYFLLKDTSSATASREYFIQMAEAEGVESDRMRFLPEVAKESVHRANLGIADIVLDTYPYNGATTTLETLWMGIPLVTRVGEQFSSRNSYTMMINAGVTEGIAWTDEEYVEWGIRLGKDPVLRQQIAWQLRRSRQTSPLWNAKEFTREMEKAYEQMWLKI